MSWGNLIKPWVSLAKGSSETLKEFFRPPVTRRYPEEPADLSSRWRGPLRLRGIMDDQPPPVTDATPEEFNGLMQELHATNTVSYTHLRAHETVLDLVCRLLLEKKKTYSPQPQP